MHKSIRKELRRFRKKYDVNGRIAELGSLNFNGSPQDYLPIEVGFDLVDGNGVDVVINPGIIPRKYHHKFDIVVSSSSFHYCPKPELYKKQILALLKLGGLVWMSMCAPSCKRCHTTSENEYGFTDCFRVTRKELCRFLKPEIKPIECYYVGDDHHEDIIYIGMETGETCVEQYAIPEECFRKPGYRTIK